MNRELNLAEVLACVRREAALRRRVYPRWVQEGRLTAEKAAHEIERMEDACVVIEKAKMLREVSDEIHEWWRQKREQEEAAKNQTEMEL